MAGTIVIVNPVRYTGFSYITTIKKKVNHSKLIAIWTSPEIRDLMSSVNNLLDEELFCDNLTDAVKLIEGVPRCVLVGNDDGFALADQLQNFYYPDRSNDPSLHEYRINKFSYFKYLKSLGLVNTDQQLVSFEDLKFFDQTKKYVIKPVNGQGNDNIFVTDGVGQLDLMNFNDQFMIQDYISGPEYCIEVCTNNGLHKCTMASIYKGDHIVDLNPWREENELISHNDPIVKILFDYIKPILTSLGVRIGVTWSQIKIKDNVPHLIEINFRSQGHGLVEPIHKSTGINWAAETLKSYLGVPQSDYEGISYQKIGGFNKISINNKKEKYMDHLPVEDLTNIDSIHFISISDRLFPGIVPVSKSVRTTMGSIIIQNTNEEQYQRDMEQINIWKQKVAY